MLDCPRTHRRTVEARGRGRGTRRRTAIRAGAVDLSSRADEGLEGLFQLGAVLLAEIDLVSPARISERDGLGAFAAVDVVGDGDDLLLCHATDRPRFFSEI